MENYLKLPIEDYQKIQGILKDLRKNAVQIIDDDFDRKDHLNNLLYIGNILFEVTHDFDSGKPDLYSDDPNERLNQALEEIGELKNQLEYCRRGREESGW